MDAAGAFKKSEIPCRIGKASFVLRAWIGNSWGARVMSQRAGTAEAEIKALIEAWQTPSGGMTCRPYWRITMTTS
jgi:hypothetical protein